MRKQSLRSLAQILPAPSFSVSAVPFSAFMARALYDPQRGYYTRQIRTVGARGDFSTTATLSNLLGKAVAAWLRQEASGQPEVVHIIEIGAGSGALMAAVRKALGWWARRKFHWHIVETSPVLQQRQKDLLGAQVTWHTDLRTALESCGGQAFIYHNELLDAFPATLLQWHDQLWHEVWITPEGRELWQPLTWDDAQRSAFHALRDWAPRATRQRLEIHPSIHDWLRHWAPVWQGGAMLTIDYGDLFPAIYDQRPAGSLRAYLLQHRLEGAEVYLNPGRQDITADINFSDYRSWAQEQGWQEAAYGTQADFIQHHIKKLPNDSLTEQLLHPEGAGGAFKYLIHRPRS